MATLYALAHYDDELFCLGQILDDLTNGKTVIIYHMCGESHDHGDRQRKDIFNDLLAKLVLGRSKCRVIYTDSKNAPLFQNKIYERQSIINKLQEINSEYGCSQVITVPADRHPDHAYLNELVKIVFRPDRNHQCNRLLEMHIPGSAIRTDFNYKLAVHKPSIKRMEEYFDLYKNHLKGLNEWEKHKIWLQYNGSTLGLDYAEAYNLVYMIA